MEVEVKITRQDSGRYDWTVDGDGFAMGGGASNAHDLLECLERVVEIVEDRAAGGSGLF